jgi:hypothetical protein
LLWRNVRPDSAEDFQRATQQHNGLANLVRLHLNLGVEGNSSPSWRVDPSNFVGLESVLDAIDNMFEPKNMKKVVVNLTKPSARLSVSRRPR